LFIWQDARRAVFLLDAVNVGDTVPKLASRRAKAGVFIGCLDAFFRADFLACTSPRHV
jgi:hypothetical protein